MRTAKPLAVCLLLLVICRLPPAVASAADGLSDFGERLQEIQKKQLEYQKKIAELQAKERTLKEQIDFMDSQVNLTTLKIDEAQTRITARTEELGELSVDIGTLQERLARLEESVGFAEKVYRARARRVYKSGRVTPLELVFGSPTLDKIFLRVKYLKVLEAADRKLMEQMRLTSSSYQKQKSLLEEKKVEVERVRAEIEREKRNLEARRSALAEQKREREYLLIETKNDEATYQKLLAEARAEQRAIEQAILGLKLEGGVEIKAGDAIALMGNSGYPYCSTGAHLHFAVRRGDVFVNPLDYLKGRSLPHQLPDGSQETITVGRGDWVWPLSDPFVISQLYGKTPYSWRYSSGLHDGVDIYNRTNFAVTAVADGTLYSGSMMCGKAVMNYVAIDHGEGLVTWYFHVQ